MAPTTAAGMEVGSLGLCFSERPCVGSNTRRWVVVRNDQGLCVAGKECDCDEADHLRLPRCLLTWPRTGIGCTYYIPSCSVASYWLLRLTLVAALPSVELR